MICRSLVLCVLLAIACLASACKPANSCEQDDDCFSGEFCYTGTCVPRSAQSDAGEDTREDDATDTTDTASTDTGQDDSASDTADGSTGDTTTADATDTTDTDTGPGVEIVSIAAGGLHTCARLASGEVMCWGRGLDGQLGNGETTTTSEETPTYVSDITDASGLDSGHLYSCAIRGDDTVWCWGANGSQQITGDDTTLSYFRPEPALLEDVVQVATGDSHTCVRTTTDDVLCIGGRGSTNNGTNVPLAVSAPTDIAAGYQHSCAVSLGQVYCWGSNGSDQLGDGSPVTGISNAEEVVAGRAHSCARLDNGQVKCWGDNSKGQLGVSGAASSPTPVTVRGIDTATRLAAGDNHNCVLQDGGGVYCWGNDLEAVDSAEPRVFGGLTTGMTDLTAGSQHSCALQRAGGVVCWGLNSYGQLGDGSTTSRSRPVAVDFD